MQIFDKILLSFLHQFCTSIVSKFFILFILLFNFLFERISTDPTTRAQFLSYLIAAKKHTIFQKFLDPPLMPPPSPSVKFCSAAPVLNQFEQKYRTSAWCHFLCSYPSLTKLMYVGGSKQTFQNLKKKLFFVV